MNLPFSILDLCPVSEGSSAGKALNESLRLAVMADELGFKRYWIAEHHGMEAIASSSPEIMISQVARMTKKIRVGSGGIMLPNHPSLRVAENFRTLEALFPGRIDLGLGRAPGTNGRTAVALRRGSAALSSDDFPQQLEELECFLNDSFPEGHPYREIKAMPQDVDFPEIWLLGSSDFSAQLSAYRGLPFAFAQHFSPLPAGPVLDLYHRQFQPSPYLAKPHALVAVNVICARTDAEAERLASSNDLAFLRFRQTGKFSPLPTVERALSTKYTPEEKASMEEHRQKLFVGSPATIKSKLFSFLDSVKVQEVAVSTLLHEPEARRESYRLLAEVAGL